MDKKKGAKVPELRVVFDTNALFTGSEAHLLNRESSDVIKQNSGHPDLVITWYLPDVVRHERQFQMETRALELLPSIQKLERLLGHQLNITEAILKQRVKESIERQLTELGLKVLQPDFMKVDWTTLTLDSCYRQPPFSEGKNEKGFRDAIIIESFFNLVSVSPTTAGRCRVVLVTGDNLMADAVKKRIGDITNVRIVESVEDLKGLINTLVEKVTEDFVKKYQEQAKAYFFQKEQQDTIYYKLAVRDAIVKEFSEILKGIPNGADERKNTKWIISSPRFVKKKGQRIYWASRIAVTAEAYKLVKPSPESIVWGSLTIPAAQSGGPFTDWLRQQPLRYQTGETISPLGAESANPSPFYVPPPTIGPYLSEQLPSFPGKIQEPWITESKKELLRSGQSVFEVIWSVSVTTTDKLVKPKVEEIAYIETIWEPSG